MRKLQLVVASCFLLYAPQPECSWCYTTDCVIAGECEYGCVCVIPELKLIGKCRPKKVEPIYDYDPWKYNWDE